MLAIGVGGADAVDAMTGTPWELKAPQIVGSCSHFLVLFVRRSFWPDFLRRYTSYGPIERMDYHERPHSPCCRQTICPSMPHSF